MKLMEHVNGNQITGTIREGNRVVAYGVYLLLLHFDEAN